MLVTDVKCHEVTVLSGLWFTLFLSPETFFLVRTGSYFFFSKTWTRYSFTRSIDF